MNDDGSIWTRNIDAAVAALRTGRCTALHGRRAGWGDAEAIRIADALEAGGHVLRVLDLRQNEITAAGAARLGSRARAAGCA